jgi:hypothetical protein
VLLGVVVVLLGLGNGSAFSFKFEKVELSTSSSGLAIIAIGALLSGYVATRLPANVMVFGIEKPTLLDQIQNLAPQLLLGGGIAVAVLLVMIVRGHHG